MIPRLTRQCRPLSMLRPLRAALTRVSTPQAHVSSFVLTSRSFSDSACNSETHAREWAIWRYIDRNSDGRVSRAEIRHMCRAFDASAHAAVVEEILFPKDADSVDFETFCRGFSIVQMVRNAARLKHWNRTFGLGVAGNVAGHMAQAGEAEAPADSVADEHPATPAAVFTFYAPHPFSVDATEQEVLERLAHFPVTNATIEFPRSEGVGNVQVEPEMGLYCDVVYAPDYKSIERLVPRRVAAFNDCSIRQLDGSEKLSEKKNWGWASKGISLRSIRVDSISRGTLVDRLVLVSYIKRDGVVHQYSVKAAARNYLLFYDELMDWIVDRLNNQQNTGKWENVFAQLVQSDYPNSMWIALGAGEYTEWGATNYLQQRDEAVVVVYDEQAYPNGLDTEIVDSLFDDKPVPSNVIGLHQTFV